MAGWAVDPTLVTEVGQESVRTSNLASQEYVTRRRSWRFASLVAAGVALAFLASGSVPARAEEPTVPASTAAAPDIPDPVYYAPAPPANPGLDLSSPTPKEPKPSVFRRWWFWTAVGAAAAATVVVIVVSSRGHAPPATDLGNQEFQP